VLPIREQDIQRAVFDHLRWRGMRGVFAVHVPNRRERNSVEAAILNGRPASNGFTPVIGPSRR
jgi:hypothetical protein